MKTHKSKEEGIAEAEAQFLATTSEKSWMVAMFSFKDGVVTLRETTNDFPNSALYDAILLLQKAASIKLGAPQVPEPLPVADHVTDPQLATEPATEVAPTAEDSLAGGTTDEVAQ
jgi:hypothetical protein